MADALINMVVLCVGIQHEWKTLREHKPGWWHVQQVPQLGEFFQHAVGTQQIYKLFLQLLVQDLVNQLHHLLPWSGLIHVLDINVVTAGDDIFTKRMVEDDLRVGSENILDGYLLALEHLSCHSRVRGKEGWVRALLLWTYTMMHVQKMHYYHIGL